MTMRLLVLTLLLLPAYLQAEVYRWVDESGNVVYSDRPPEGAKDPKPVQLPGVSTYKPAPSGTAQAEPAEPDKPPAAETYSLAIEAPKPDGTVRSNQGIVKVTLSTEPPLGRGHRYALQLDDGEVRHTAGRHPEYSGVARGTHQLSAWVENAAGDRLSNRTTVTFHMHQTSKLHPKPKPLGVR